MAFRERQKQEFTALISENGSNFHDKNGESLLMSALFKWYQKLGFIPISYHVIQLHLFFISAKLMSEEEVSERVIAILKMEFLFEKCSRWGFHTLSKHSKVSINTLSSHRAKYYVENTEIIFPFLLNFHLYRFIHINWFLMRWNICSIHTSFSWFPRPKVWEQNFCENTLYNIPRPELYRNITFVDEE